jgi:hypothetical protein
MIQTLFVYPHVEDKQFFWAFDFPALGIMQEPFVDGIPEILESAIESELRIRADKEGGIFPVVATRLPGFIVMFETSQACKERPPILEPHRGRITIELQKVEPKNGGTVYKDTTTNMQGWLCPALNKFFPESPETIWVRVVLLGQFGR